MPDGPIAANRFEANAAGTATAASTRFVYETDTAILRFNSNGSAAGGVTVVATLHRRGRDGGRHQHFLTDA